MIVSDLDYMEDYMEDVSANSITGGSSYYERYFLITQMVIANSFGLSRGGDATAIAISKATIFFGRKVR